MSDVSAKVSNFRFSICEIGLEHLDELLDLRMEVISNVFSNEIYDEKQLRNANRKFFERRIPKGEYIACFALNSMSQNFSNKDILGTGGICILEQMPSPDNPIGYIGYIMNIYTRENARKKGIGSSVVSWLIQRSKQKNINHFYLETTSKGRPVYESLGFRDVNDYLELLL